MTQANGQTMAFTDWTSASDYLQSLGNRGKPINQFAILYDDRFNAAA